MITYSVYINGDKAINTAKKLIGDYCYKNIDSIGCFEIVLNSDEIYNGYIQKWVSVSCIESLDVLKNKTIVFLKNHGFSGCVAEIIEEETPEHECCINQTLLETITL